MLSSHHHLDYWNSFRLWDQVLFWRYFMLLPFFMLIIIFSPHTYSVYMEGEGTVTHHHLLIIACFLFKPGGFVWQYLLHTIALQMRFSFDLPHRFGDPVCGTCPLSQADWMSPRTNEASSRGSWAIFSIMSPSIPAAVPVRIISWTSRERFSSISARRSSASLVGSSFTASLSMSCLVEMSKETIVTLVAQDALGKLRRSAPDEGMDADIASRLAILRRLWAGGGWGKWSSGPHVTVTSVTEHCLSLHRSPNVDAWMRVVRAEAMFCWVTNWPQSPS